MKIFPEWKPYNSLWENLSDLFSWIAGNVFLTALSLGWIAIIIWCGHALFGSYFDVYIAGTTNLISYGFVDLAPVLAHASGIISLLTIACLILFYAARLINHSLTSIKASEFTKQAVHFCVCFSLAAAVPCVVLNSYDFHYTQEEFNTVQLEVALLCVIPFGVVNIISLIKEKNKNVEQCTQ